MSDMQPDLNALLQQAQALQSQLLQARDEAASKTVEGVAAGGKVRVSVTGGMEFQSVRIDPELLDDVTMLEDLLLAALRDAVEKVNAVNEEATGDLGSMFQ